MNPKSIKSVLAFNREILTENLIELYKESLALSEKLLLAIEMANTAIDSRG